MITSPTRADEVLPFLSSLVWSSALDPDPFPIPERPMPIEDKAAHQCDLSLSAQLAKYRESGPAPARMCLGMHRFSRAFRMHVYPLPLFPPLSLRRSSPIAIAFTILYSAPSYPPISGCVRHQDWSCSLQSQTNWLSR